MPNPLPSAEGATKAELETVGKKLEEYGVVGSKDGEIGVPGYDHGVAEAEKRNQSEDASKIRLSIHSVGGEVLTASKAYGRN